MPVIGGIMVPHPPLIHPQVGRGGEEAVVQTAEAFRAAARWLMGEGPDVLVIISPHSVMYSDYLHLSPGAGAAGSLARFGAPSARFQVRYDQELVLGIELAARERGLPAGIQGERDKALDHGTMIPLYFLQQTKEWPPPQGIVRIGLSGLPFGDHYRLGICVRDAARRLGRRVGVVASGDLSHYLRPDGPYGFRPEGPEYDRKLMDIMGRGAFGELLGLEEALCERAGECGQRSFLILAGALDGMAVTARALSYEGVTGVGYGVCTFQPAGPDPARAFLGQKGDTDV